MNKGKTKGKQEIYRDIIGLPFSEKEDDYKKHYHKILTSNLVTNEFKKYLKKRNSLKHKWVKCYMKNLFTCGTCTTSRIESKHRIYKTFLNGNSRLCEIFLTFKKLESREIDKDKQELLTKPQNSKLNDHEFIKEMSTFYSQFILNQLKLNLIDAISYMVKAQNKNLWYSLLFSKLMLLGLLKELKKKQGLS